MSRKDIISLLSLLLLIIGCNHLELAERQKLAETKSTSSHYSEQDAILAVVSLVNKLDTASSRTYSREIASTEYVPELVDANEGKVLSSPVYIFNFRGDAGFAIASADGSLPPVLCLTDTGHFHAGDQLPFGAVAMLSRAETAYKRFVRSRSGEMHWYDFPPESYYITWTTLGTTSPVGQQVGCNWGQEPKFNNQCPLIDTTRTLAGCVPVAVGQIMYYYKKNTTYDGYYYNWSDMRFVVDINSCPTFLAGWQGVAHLLRALGNPENLDAEYGIDATSAYSSYIPRTFEHFGYQSGGTESESQYWNLSYEIAHGHPVLISGNDTLIISTNSNGLIDTSYSGGHTWVADQVMSALRIVTVYQPHSSNIVFRDTVRQYFTHCNWGWSGMYNGFFLHDEYNYYKPLSIPSKSLIDTISSTNCYRYNLTQITGIRP